MIAAVVLATALVASEPDLTVECVKPHEALIGTGIDLQFVLRNSGTATATVSAATLDERSFHFEVRYDDGVVGVYARRLAEPPARVTLEPGATLEFKAWIPAIAGGDWWIRPLYASGEESIAGEAITVRVAASGNWQEDALEIETTRGKVIAQLDPKAAPAACLLITQLALDRRFDDQPIDRIVRDAFVQIGSTAAKTAPLADRATLPLDASPSRHVRGALTLWREGVVGEDMKKPERRPTGNGSFLICLDDEPWLDGRYCVFGRVHQGIELLDALSKEPLVTAVNGELSKPKEPARVVAVRRVIAPSR